MACLLFLDDFFFSSNFHDRNKTRRHESNGITFEMFHNKKFCWHFVGNVNIHVPLSWCLFNNIRKLRKKFTIRPLKVFQKKTKGARRSIFKETEVREVKFGGFIIYLTLIEVSLAAKFEQKPSNINIFLIIVWLNDF